MARTPIALQTFTTEVVRHLQAPDRPSSKPSRKLWGRLRASPVGCGRNRSPVRRRQSLHAIKEVMFESGKIKETLHLWAA